MNISTASWLWLVPAAASGLLLAGCDNVCNYASCEGSGGTGATGTSATSPTSSSTGIPAACLLQDGRAIASDCGVFVKAGASGNGSQASPFGSVVEAVAGLGASKAIYVCGGDTFKGSVTLASGGSLFGGLDCATWTFASSNPRAKVQSDADLPGVTLSKGSGMTMLDSVDVEAVDAVGAGASSIALFVDGATADLRRASFKSGSGAKGAPGESPLAPVGQAAAGLKGTPGCGAPSDAMATGLGGMNNCGVEDVTGGQGGPGGTGTSGFPGIAGGPTQTGGISGVGQTGSSCGAGGQAMDGSVGGAGALASGTGSLSAGSFGPTLAPDASLGARGTGGGGGGGGKKCSTNAVGPGGGGGGAGGCGGAGGHGGHGGGASFAIASLNGIVTMSDVKLTSSSGGAGGLGGDGQGGQLGGDGGLKGANAGDAVSIACSGGTGGIGGQGGPAAGGNGGPSATIAKKGGSITRMGAVNDITGLGSAGGPGSDNAGTTTAAPTGTGGLACPILDFDTSACAL